MKIIEKLLYLIAALLTLFFIFMLVCIANPAARDFASNIVNNIVTATANSEEDGQEPEDGTAAATSGQENNESTDDAEASAQTDGNGSSQTSGNGSSQTDGNGSSQTDGNGSSQTSGNGSSQTDGNGSSQTSGDGNSQTDGNGSSQTDGNGSSQTSGNGSSQTNGNGNSQTNGNGNSQTNGNGNSQTNGNGNSQSDGNGSAQTDASTQEAGNAQTDESNQTNFTKLKPKPRKKPYEEYAKKWTGDGISDEYLNNTTYNDTVKELPVDSDTNEEELRKAYEDSRESRNDYQVTETEVKVVENEEEALEVLKDTDVGETGEKEKFDPLYYPYYDMLNEKGKKLYKQIYANAMALNDTFLPVEDATGSEWDTAMFSVVYDHPELFWLDAALYRQYDYNGNVIKLKLYFYDELPDIPAAKKVFEEKAQEMIAGAKDLETDYEKEKYIHDLLGNKLTYEFADLNQSAYSAIVNDATVCAGYSKGFQYLMQQLEVPTYTCVGWGGYSRSNGSMHGWNIIKLDSDYYNVDCTWDDDDPVRYDYFNLSDADNDLHTRMLNSVYLPPCNGGQYSGLEKMTLSDYGFKDSDVVRSMDDYYELCKNKTLNENVQDGDKSYKCSFNTVISKDIYKKWESDYKNNKEYEKYLDEVIGTLANGEQYDFFVPIGFVLCDTEELDDGNWLINHAIYMSYVAYNF